MLVGQPKPGNRFVRRHAGRRTTSWLKRFLLYFRYLRILHATTHVYAEVADIM